MIENDNQYQIAKKWAAAFPNRLQRLKDNRDIHPALKAARLIQYLSILAGMLEDIREYEQKSGSK